MRLDDVGALAFTSANGVRAFVHHSGRRDLPVFAIGLSTAGAARDAGFKSVVSAGGELQSLADAIIDAAGRKLLDGAVLHPAGVNRAGDLVGMLALAHVSARRLALYKARRAAIFPSEAAAALKDGAIDYVTLFSPRTARHFAALTKRMSSPPDFSNTTLVCLSDAVAGPVAALSWRRIEIAQARSTNAILDAITQGA